MPLRWRHNDHAGVSNHQPHGCLLNRLFRRKSKKTSKLRVTGLCAGNSPGTGEFPAQMASYAENVSIWWRHHANPTVAQYIHKYFQWRYMGGMTPRPNHRQLDYLIVLTTKKTSKLGITGPLSKESLQSAITVKSVYVSWYMRITNYSKLVLLHMKYTRIYHGCLSSSNYNLTTVKGMPLRWCMHCKSFSM